MADLIDRNELLVELNNPAIYKLEDRKYWLESNVVNAIALEQLSADAVPVVHGRWIDNCDEWIGDSRYTCSICGEEWSFIEGTPADNNCNFCPQCGAKMDGGNE